MKQTMRIIFSRPLNEYELNTHNKKKPEKKQKKKHNFTIFFTWNFLNYFFLSKFGHLNQNLIFVENEIILIINFKDFINMKKSVLNLWSRGNGLLHYYSVDVFMSATTCTSFIILFFSLSMQSEEFHYIIPMIENSK